MFRIDEILKATGPSPWIFGIVGLFALSVGLVFVMRPRKSGETLWRITQATRPWHVRKVPVGLSIAFGCLGLLIAAAMFYIAWAFLQG
jgi:hypothetical protein